MQSFILIYRLYVSTTRLKRNVDANRLLRTRPTFSRSLMVSVAISKHGCTELFFVEPGVKVKGEYCRNALLMEKMLPAIWRMSSDLFISRQDSAPAYRAKDIIALLRRETLSFIGLELWPANSPDLNPVDFRIWGLIQERVYQTAIRDNDELKERLIVVWAELTQRVMTKLLHSGGQG